MAHGPRLDRCTCSKRLHDVAPLRPVRRHLAIGFDNAAKQGRQRIGRLAGPEPTEIAALVGRGRFQRLAGTRRPVGKGEFVREHAAAVLAARERGSQRRHREADLDRQIACCLKLLGADAGTPFRRVAIDLVAGNRRIEQRLQGEDIDGCGAAAQRHAFERVGALAHLITRKPEARQRVLEQRNEGHGIAGAQACLQKQTHEAALGRRGQRRAGGIVRLDAEAGELGADPPREISVGRDQRRLAILAAFQRKP
ncbi:hypothetical protein D9M70_417550 [compost metagenome]